MDVTKDKEFYYRQGIVVEDDVMGVIKEVEERWPGLIKFQYCEDYAPNLWNAPYRVIERCSDGAWRPVFECWKIDREVIHRLEAADMHKGGTDLLTLIRKEEEKKRRDAKTSLDEQHEENKDRVIGALKSPKSKYTWKKPDGTLAVIRKDPPVGGPEGRK